MTIAEAAEIYDTTPRTVHRWKEIGVEKGLPCPFDVPADMPPWWQKCMERRCPEGVLAAAAVAVKNSNASPLPEGGSEGDKSSEPCLPTNSGSAQEPLKPPLPGEIGFSQTIERLRTAEAALGRAYETAVEAGEVDRAERVRREWMQLTEELRKAEMASLEMAKRARALGSACDWLPRNLVCSLIDKLHARIPHRLIQSLIAAYPDALRAVAGEDTRKQWSEFVVRFFDGALGSITRTKFADTLQGAESAAA